MRRFELGVLLFSVFLIAICGLLYELLISTISTYFLGSSILHFSLTIGIFMSAMGLGSYLSKFLHGNLLDRFVEIELFLGLAGGFSALLLYLTYSYTGNYYLVLILLIVLLGALIGLEIPILTRVVKPYGSLKDAVAQVLSFDYIGALLAAILFPIFLLPVFGTMRTSFLVGFLNVLVALLVIIVFRARLRYYLRHLLTAGLILVFCVFGFIYSGQLVRLFEVQLYEDDVVFTAQSPYQRVVLTQRGDKDFRLYLNGSLQFASLDEYRYHEPLVHIPMLLAPNPKRVLILGGGDGLATQRVLSYGEAVQEIWLVDLDPTVTRLAKNHPLFRRLNDDALRQPRVHIRNEDAFKFLEASEKLYDVIIIDLPDPNDHGLSKLYSREFYELVKQRLTGAGVMVTQSTSPYFAANAFWCIHQTLEAVFGQRVAPYVAEVPTFGGFWGFNVAQNSSFLPPSRQPASCTPGTVCPNPWITSMQARLRNKLREQPAAYKSQLQFLSAATLQKLFIIDPDFAERPTAVNQLNSHPLVQYYEKSWENWQ